MDFSFLTHYGSGCQCAWKLVSSTTREVRFGSLNPAHTYFAKATSNTAGALYSQDSPAIVPSSQPTLPDAHKAFRPNITTHSMISPIENISNGRVNKRTGTAEKTTPETLHWLSGFPANK